MLSEAQSGLCPGLCGFVGIMDSCNHVYLAPVALQLLCSLLGPEPEARHT